MTERRAPGPGRDQRGFTLVELMVVVAIIGLLASIAIPELRRAMYRTRRNAAIEELTTLREELLKYAADKGSYPTWGSLSTSRLVPLYPTYIARPERLLDNFVNRQLDYYIPWNFFDDWDGYDWDAPQGFTLRATLAFDRETCFYITDGSMYVYYKGWLTPVNNL